MAYIAIISQFDYLLIIKKEFIALNSKKVYLSSINKMDPIIDEGIIYFNDSQDPNYSCHTCYHRSNHEQISSINLNHCDISSTNKEAPVSF